MKVKKNLEDLYNKEYQCFFGFIFYLALRSFLCRFSRTSFYSFEVL